MSFVDILPVEVVHDIFVLCGLDTSDFKVDWSTTTSLKRSLPTYPIFLTRVSKSWANAAFSCRLLWSTISARIGDEGRKCWPPTDVIEAWIQRAGNSLLSISIMPHVWQQDGMYYAHSPDARYALENIIVLHRGRWRRVALWYSPATFYLGDVLKPTVSQGYSSLESLSIWGILDTDSILHLVSNAPRLRSLELEPRGPRHRYRVPALLGQAVEDAIPWKQLRELHMGVLGGKLDHAEEVLQLLQICPQLEAMTIPMVRSRTPDMGVQTPLIHHDHLLKLDFGQSTQGQCLFFLDHITLPSLTSVVLNPASDYDDDFSAGDYTLVNAFASFVTRSGCEIKEFIYRRHKNAPLRKDPLPSSHFVLSLLPIVSPSVAQLFIEVGKADIDGLVDYLTLVPPSQNPTSSSYSVPCPQLRHLTLILWPNDKSPQAVDYYVHPARLFRLIRSRWSPSAGYPCDAQMLEYIAIQIMVKEERRRAGNVGNNTSSSVHIQRLIDGMKEHSGRLRALARGTMDRRLRLAVVSPPRQLYSQSCGARR